MRRLALLVGLLVALWPAPARALLERGVVFRPGEQVQIKSDNISYYRSSNLYYAEGGVEIRYGDNVLTADKVIVDRQNKLVTASGRVRLTDGESVLTSERVVAHLDDRTGMIFGGTVYLKDSGYRFSGERIEKVGDDEFIIRRGSLTTCDCGPDVTPSWYISARSLWVTVGGYARVQNALFYVKGVPVLYLPFGYFPVKTERELGLLFPNMTYEPGKRGFIVRQGLFIPIGDSADATLTADYYSQLGYGATGEFRYVAERGSYGTTNVQFVRQTKDAQGKVSNLRSDRFQVDSTHRYNFGDYQAAVADIHVVSDQRYYADLASTLDQKATQFTRSEVAYVNSFERVSLLGQSELYDRLGTAFGASVNRMPHLEALAPSRPLFEGGPLLSVRGFADNFVTKPPGTQIFETDTYRTVGQRADLTLRVEQPIAAGPALVVPYALGRETAYRSTFGGADQNRETGAVGARLSAPFERSFEYGSWPTGTVDRMVFHRVTPQAHYVFVPQVGQSRLPEFDELDRIRRRNLLIYGLENDVYWGGAAGAPRALLKAGVFRQYAIETTGGADPNSPLLTRLGFEYPGVFGASVTEYYDPKAVRYKNYHGVYRVETSTLGAFLSLEFHRLSNYLVDDQARVVVTEDVDDAYRRYEAPVPWASREIWGTVSRNFWQHLTLSYGTRYSLDRRLVLESIYGANFLSLCNCWSVAGRLIQRPNNELLVSVTFTLIGLGSVGNQ